MVRQSDVVNILNTVQSSITGASTSAVDLMSKSLQNAVESITERILQVETNIQCNIRSIEDDLAALGGLVRDELAGKFEAEDAGIGNNTGGLHGQQLSAAPPVRSISPAVPVPLPGQQQSAAALNTSAVPMPNAPPAKEMPSPRSPPTGSVARAPPSPLEQIFAKDAVRNPSQKQIDQLVRQLNQGSLGEKEFINTFSSRSRRRSARASQVDILNTLHDCSNLRTKTYCFHRANLIDRHANSHDEARTSVIAADVHALHT
jgi:hypothetical protein